MSYSALIQPWFSTATRFLGADLIYFARLLFIYLTNLGERRGLWVKLVKFGRLGQQIQPDLRETDAVGFSPSGDSSWTYVPVRYRWTNADLPLARLPTIP